jgi:hypothetical protein
MAYSLRSVSTCGHGNLNVERSVRVQSSSPPWEVSMNPKQRSLTVINVPHVEVDHTVASTKLLGPYLDAHTLNYTNHQSLLVFVIRDTSRIHNTAKARLSQKGMRRWGSGRSRASTANPFQRKVMSVVIGATVWSTSAWGMLGVSRRMWRRPPLQSPSTVQFGSAACM